MTKALYAGSFDPLTNGHLNIIERASKLFDEIVVVVSASTAKKYLFSLDDRLDMLKIAVQERSLQNVEMISYDGLTVRLAEKLEVSVLVRGIRSVKDMEYEVDIAALNKLQNDSIETVFLISDEQYRSISSTMVKEIAFYNGELNRLVPAHVEKALNTIQNESR